MQQTSAVKLDPKQAHVIATWKHEHPLIACRFDPQGRYVVATSEDNSVQRFAVADGAKTPFAPGHDSWPRAVAFTSDGKFTVTGGSDGRLIWWETAAKAPQPIRKIDAHKGWIRSLDVSPDGKLLVSGGNDNAVRLWNIADGTPVKELLGHERHVYCVYFHPRDNNIVLSGDLVGVLKQWDVNAGKETRSFDAKALTSYNGGQQVDFGGVRALALSPDDKYLAAGGLHKATNPLGAVHEPLSLLFDWQSQKLVSSQVADGAKGVIWRSLFLNESLLMAVSGGTSGGLLCFWKPDNAKEFHRFKLPRIARDMDRHPDGIRVCTAHHDGNIRITRLAPKAEAT